MSDGVLASIVISTFNRAEALRQTLVALDGQTVGTDAYEVIVVDDGSSDGTQATLATVEVGYELRTARHANNRGVSAGRNTGIRMARGRYLVFVSDDVIVPATFLADHVSTLQRVPGRWVVGGFRQLPSLTETAFGRYLDDLERGFERGRTSASLGPNLWEMEWPTARNLSLPRSDLEKTGLFDERFRTCCEDQDLATRARSAGIRFVYNANIECLHNDQAGDLRRYCSFQQRGARDTVLLCSMYPELHGASPLVTANSPISRRDSPTLAVRKLVKLLLSRRWPRFALEKALYVAERAGAPDAVLRRGYRVVIALATFRGWQEGLADASPQRDGAASMRRA